MERRTLLLIGFCLGVFAGNLCAADPAFDSDDEHALTLALRAIKMTSYDLSFAKTNAESELVLDKARLFLNQPLKLPAYAQHVLTNLQAATTLISLANFAYEQLELRHPTHSSASASFQFLDRDELAKLPPPLAAAVTRIFLCAATAVRPALLAALPAEQNAPFAAFALQALDLKADPAELDAWDKAGLQTSAVRELLRRDQALELQDCEVADRILSAADHFNEERLLAGFQQLAYTVDEVIAGLKTNTFTESFQVTLDSDLGPIILGGVGRNVYTNEAFLIIDTGGDDVYENSAGGANGLAGRPISIVIDLAGNDQFISKRSFSQGSGVFGIGILAALGSNCTFQAKHLSQGAGLFGCGLLMTGPGQQTFEGNTFCQGAGTFGAGILGQRGGDTTYRAAEMAQGFGGTQGVGVLLDESGNDSYFAGGKYPCGWLAGHNFSLSQGFGYGMRPFAGGGMGILCDLKGDDHYVADVYGQGASYWYSVGLLLDADGNDKDDAYQYCQGAGIHLSSGALVDWAGNDTYTAGHICQGGAHDFAVGMLIDRAGNDQYIGDTTAQGSAINNSFAMLLDHAGNDRYTGTDPQQSQAAGQDGGKREYGSIALLVDLAGQDTYSQGQSNNAVWLKPWYGAGLDYESPTNVVAALLRSAEPDEPHGASQKRLYSIAPVDPQQPVEHLLRLAISDKPDADKAWSDLKHLGTEALPYLLSRLDSPDVLVRSKVEELVDSISTNAAPILAAGIDTAKNDEVARLCCYFLARFETATNTIPHVLPLLQRDKTRGTAFYTLGHLRAREAYAPALAALNERELVRLRATQALGRIGDRRAIPNLIPQLDDEIYDVRYAAEDALVSFGKSSIGPLRNTFAKASPQARPHIIEALARLHDRRALTLAGQEYRQDDPLVRAAIEKALAYQLQSRP